MDRERELLPVQYFHIVFTLPSEFNQLAIEHPKDVYGALFKACSKTLSSFAADPKYLGAKSGATMVLHTWGQKIGLHPHLHCIVPSGGISKNGKWKKARKIHNKYLYPVKALSKLFRGAYMHALRYQGIEIPQNVAKAVMSKGWVVYAKKPFNKPEYVIRYLGRYTHKVAITNFRITGYRDGRVYFSYKDYRNGGLVKHETSLETIEFIRRFAMHILPSGFMRIRHYGMLASRNKPVDLKQAKKYFGLEWREKEKIDWVTITVERLDYIPDQCLHCKEGVLILIETIHPRRGPPMLYIHDVKKSKYAHHES